MKVELSWFSRELAEVMDQAYGLVAMRLYVTRDDTPTPTQEKILVPIEESNFELPNNLVPFLRYSRPNLQGLVEQAADEALIMGRLGIATCGNRGLVTDVKNAAARNLKGSMPDIYCHAEEFDY
jgi:Ferric reductase NAD binding domain